MARIPETFIDELLSRLDIVEIIDQRVKLKKSGKNYSACCPFHQEKTPSFTVSPDKQFYYCFGCGVSGNAIGFLMEYDRSGFVESVESLASHAGLEVPREEVSVAVKQQQQKHRQHYDILEQAAEYFTEQLRQHPQKNQAVEYLKNRGLSGKVAKEFGLGFAPPGWDNLLLRLGQNEEAIHLLVDAGLAVQREDTQRIYDRFRHRIMFPILDNRGRTIGFGGRVLGNDKPKYLNSPETPVFHKARELYGLYQARQANRELEYLLVVEGYMDVIALAQYQITQAVATLGTACGEEHLTLAFRHTNKIIFCFDGDAAGRQAAKRAFLNALTSMQDGREISFLFLPDGQDPDTLVRQIGKERFTIQLKNAIPIEEFLFEVAAENINTSSMEGRAKFAKIAAPLIHKLPQGIYRELMLKNLADRTGLSSAQLQELTQLDANKLLEPQPSPAPVNEPAATENPELPPYPDDYEAVDTTAPPISRRSALEWTPVRIATMLLMDQPQLLDGDIELPEIENDRELAQLRDLIQFIKRRPQSTFNSILGYWAGAYGLEAQGALAKLMANQVLHSTKNLVIYNAKRELDDALKRIQNNHRRQNVEAELQYLNSINYSELEPEQKKRLKELVQAQHRSHNKN